MRDRLSHLDFMDACRLLGTDGKQLLLRGGGLDIGRTDALRIDEREARLVTEEWTTMLDLIEPLLRARKLAFVRLDGSVPQKKRQALVSQFQSDPRTRVFLTTNAGSTGLNLQAANVVINVDLPWNPAVLEQRIARAHRMGQARPVHVYVLVTEGTLEENLLTTLSTKRDLAMAALDPESKVVDVDVQSQGDDIKKRLEVLLGEKPEAPVEETMKPSVAAGRLAATSGNFVRAAVELLGELAGEAVARDLSSTLDVKVGVDEEGDVTQPLN